MISGSDAHPVAIENRREIVRMDGDEGRETVPLRDWLPAGTGRVQMLACPKHGALEVAEDDLRAALPPRGSAFIFVTTRSRRFKTRAQADASQSARRSL